MSLNETWLNFGGKHAARLVIMSVNGSRGLGLSRLSFNAELTPRDELAAELPVWFSGRLEMIGLIGGSDASTHVAQLHIERQPIVLPKLGDHTILTFTADVDDRQMQIIEQHRSGGLRLRIWPSAATFRSEIHEAVHVNCFEYTVSQSEWIAILEQVGFTRRLLIELEVPNAQAAPELKEALEHYAHARRRYMEGEARQVVESLRQCLAVLVGKKADDEEEEASINTGLKTLSKDSKNTRIGYRARYELVRRTMKFLCDIGAHPEADETLRQDARAALTMVAGLLEGFRVRTT